MRIRSWHAMLIACAATLGVACNSALSSNSVCGGSIFLVVANGKSSTIAVGDSLQLVAQQGVLGPGVGGSGCTIQNIPANSVAWSTSDTTVATVGPDGSAHGIAAGSADVTAARGGLDATLKVTVVP